MNKLYLDFTDFQLTLQRILYKNTTHSPWNTLTSGAPYSPFCLEGTGGRVWTTSVDGVSEGYSSPRWFLSCHAEKIGSSQKTECRPKRIVCPDTLPFTMVG